MKLNSTVKHSLSQWIVDNKIKGVLFDLDDTLIKTSEIFFEATDKVISLYVDIVPALERQVVIDLLAEINIAAYQKRAVNPNRWDIVIPKLEEKLGVSESLADQSLKVLASIYKKHPEFEGGALELIKLLKESQLVVGIVTHANVEWTQFKLNSLGLSSFFDHVEIIDENQLHKNHDDWKRAASKLNLEPSQLLAVGDNVKGDVQAASQAGFGQVAWVDKKGGWDLYRQGQLPPSVIVVQNVAELLTLDANSTF